MKIRAGGISHPGKCREKNEDNFCFNGKTLTAEGTARPLRFRAAADKPTFFGVFDGMGGIQAGEKASAIAVETAQTAMQDLSSDTDYETFLIDICRTANRLTCDEMTHVLKQRMGTTASMLLFAKEQYWLCNIGDSPVYLFRDDTLQPIFCEHTEKQNYLRLHGVDAPLPKRKFRLTQHIGIFHDELEIEPYVATDRIQPKDRFLITSDGLTDMVTEEAIAETLKKRKSPAKTVKLLMQQALDNGGKDNITIICIDVI